ncbi:hypothetical protein LOZ39_006650 [Ophidiomyces ophidiicola]|uniref:Uncharacterized protein n=1 Tax=Ophidiomyces ophidiicola TaxID=1387563 RepID=A0ACB8UQJ9_9EURO|nr:hypothetical protein LOZ64_006673 [Ophidiomyces ophidiicola]KAI1932154.1 hypothetical protein LOZ62_006719 [Ophidiomyces ophidiicola]KAI1960523.1 hypothetical protein LOZ56_006800 [Ophidiomyces ophidiicola]KAI2000491.1 hypothetical protein LOZ50_005881 [Ophidiomyces ophidiicola]KAI2006757.1 hypothetical protein LOZ46_006820 [Ophidiomyces ophidiicola]
MSLKESIESVKDIINYKFKSKPLLLKTLMTAESELSNYDGNRRLAQLETFKIQFGSNEHYATVAKHTDIDSYISYSSKSGAKALTVLAKSVNAIIATTFVNLRDIAVALRTMLHLELMINLASTVNLNLTLFFDSVLVEENSCINSRLLTLDPEEACKTIYSLMSLLIEGDSVDNISSSERCIMLSQSFNDFSLDSLAIEDEILCATVIKNGYDPRLKFNLETE